MSDIIVGPLFSSPIMTRHSANPILTPGDVPYGPALVFNAGVTKFKGKYVMVFRNDYGDELKGIVAPHHTTNLGLAFSDDGIKWMCSRNRAGLGMMKRSSACMIRV